MREQETGKEVAQVAQREEKRQRGLDLLRVVSMFLVVILHLLGRGGVLAAAPYGSGAYQAAWLLECGAYCAVDCYGLLSGYLLCRSRCRSEGLVRLWLQVLFWSAGLTALFALVWEPVSGKRFLLSCLPVVTEQYWYFTAYFGVYALAPFFNRLIAHLSARSFRRLLAVGFVLLSLLPTLAGQDTFQTEGGYSFLWLAALYFAGAYLRLHGRACRHPLWYLAGYVGFVLAAWGSKWALETISLLRTGAVSGGGRFLTYPSPLILGAALCLFFACSGLKLQGRLWDAVLGFLAPASFGVYLIHVQPFVFNRWLDESLAWLPALGGWRVLVTVPALALGLYLLCTVLEWGRLLLFRLLRTSALERRVGVWLDRFRLPEPEEPAGKP